ncbi:hypothetical protein [uncultured Rhodoblastus sp.]|uniref:hypothetical protein n=1 Tax=uncultured Rhodoblastus sp. TaxID=543037 RepID=UPI0025F50B19|nr:hypothetical protein [uncultured Rhodoblastus sp.]
MTGETNWASRKGVIHLQNRRRDRNYSIRLQHRAGQCRRFQKIPGAALAGANPHSRNADGFRQAHIRIAIADHDGLVRPKVKIPHRRFHHARRGFATVAAFVRPVGAMIDGGDVYLLLGQHLPQTAVDAFERFLIEKAARYSGLVGDKHQGEAFVAQQAHAFKGAGRKFDFVGVAQIDLVDDHRAIAIEQRNFFLNVFFHPVCFPSRAFARPVRHGDGSRQPFPP